MIPHSSTTWSKIMVRVNKRIKEFEERRIKKRSTINFKRDGVKGVASRGAAATGTFFFNYNTVEGILLSCAVFINPSGIMFQAFADCGRDIPGFVSQFTLYPSPLVCDLYQFCDSMHVTHSYRAFTGTMIRRRSC